MHKWTIICLLLIIMMTILYILELKGVTNISKFIFNLSGCPSNNNLRIIALTVFYLIMIYSFIYVY